MRGCLVFLVGLVVGALLLAVTQVFLLRPPPLAPSAPASADLQILFRNQFLTRELQAQASQVAAPLTFQGLTVQSEPGLGLVLTGRVSAPNVGVAIPARIVVHPVVVQNHVRIDVVQVQAGTLKIPGAIFQGLAASINRQLDQSLGNSGDRIVNLTTTEEGLLVDVAIAR